jgi:hypothetical protein
MKPRLTIQDLERLQLTGKIRSFLVKQKQEPQKEKRSKYGNHKHEVDGILFDSKKEATRYGQLRLKMKAGEIGQLELQKVYELKVEGERVCKYKADFVYMIMATGETVVEDVKSEATRKLPVYRLKKKLMKQLLNIEIVEV